MIKFFTKKMSNKKGFTLIELIVVIAILGILAAIAIPRFTGFRSEANIKAEGSTAVSIISAARVKEAETGNSISGIVTTTNLEPKYMILPGSPEYTLGKTAGTETVKVGGADVIVSKDLYKITWTSTVTGYTVEQTIIEGYTFEPKSS